MCLWRGAPPPLLHNPPDGCTAPSSRRDMDWKGRQRVAGRTAPLSCSPTIPRSTRTHTWSLNKLKAGDGQRESRARTARDSLHTAWFPLPSASADELVEFARTWDRLRSQSQASLLFTISTLYQTMYFLTFHQTERLFAGLICNSHCATAVAVLVLCVCERIALRLPVLASILHHQHVATRGRWVDQVEVMLPYMPQVTAVLCAYTQKNIRYIRPNNTCFKYSTSLHIRKSVISSLPVHRIYLNNQ